MNDFRCFFSVFLQIREPAAHVFGVRFEVFNEHLMINGFPSIQFVQVEDIAMNDIDVSINAFHKLRRRDLYPIV